MKIIFWGTPKYSVEALEELIKSNHEVIAVVTQPDKKRSRGSTLRASPVKELALKNNIQCLCPERIKGNKNLELILKEKDCDLFIVIAYGKILTPEILKIPKLGAWNAHASLLPRWRGAAPIQWSIMSGDEFTGVGIMKMEEGLDTGDVLLEEQIKINTNDNLLTLSERLSALSAKLVLKSLEIIKENSLTGIMETTSQSFFKREHKYARMIDKLDYFINLNDSAINITRKVKGLYPKAYVNYNNKNLKILSVQIITYEELTLRYKIFFSKSDNKPGEIIYIIKNTGIVISTLTDPLLILEIKLEGKKIANGSQLIQHLNPIINKDLS